MKKKVNGELDPSCIRTVNLKIRKNVNYTHGTVTFPKDLIKRFGLKHEDDIIICFLGKSEPEGEDSPGE